jgi:predicted enzyme related to lactoylglutathione lyase
MSGQVELKVLINLDVDDVERAVRFYTEGIGLRVGRRFDADFVELLGADVPLYLLRKDSGTQPFANASQARGYERHWTPLHFDFLVRDLDSAVARATAAGALLEEPASDHVYGRLALLSDPFGHGFCLLEFRGRGYGELNASSDARA